MREICAFFDVRESHELTWAHQVNDAGLTAACCADAGLMMLEGDVVFTENCQEPMMGSPFRVDGVMQPGAFSLERWLELAIRHQKGVKLDIQSPAALEPALQVIAELNPETPVMIHADIFNLLHNPELHFEPEMFVQLAQRYMPSATLSIGWALTRDQDTDGKLEEILIDQMTELVLEKLGGMPYTIEFRAGYTSNWEKGAAIIFEPIDDVERPNFGENVIDGIAYFRKHMFVANE